MADYITEAHKDKIITKMIGGGESDTVTFPASASRYPYVCSFPGRALMRGNLVVIAP